MRNSAALLGVALAVLLSPGPALAGEDSGSAAARAVRFPGHLGLTGFMDMVDARTPGVFQLRTGLRYSGSVRDRDFDRGPVHLSQRRERHAFESYLGVSLLGLVDVSARMPYLRQEDRLNRKGLGDLDAEVESGWGDLDLAAKITLEAGPFVIAPYLHGKLPTGEPTLEDLAELNYGSAATFTLLNSYLALHANVGGVHIEEGTVAFRYRAGVSFVLFASEDWLVRSFIYGDGIEYDGSGDSDVDLEFGVQSFLFGMISVEVGVSLRLLDAGHVDDDLARAVRGQAEPNPTGGISKHFEDDGTWGVTIAVGTLF